MCFFKLTKKGNASEKILPPLYSSLSTNKKPQQFKQQQSKYDNNNNKKGGGFHNNQQTPNTIQHARRSMTNKTTLNNNHSNNHSPTINHKTEINLPNDIVLFFFSFCFVSNPFRLCILFCGYTKIILRFCATKKNNNNSRILFGIFCLFSEKFCMHCTKKNKKKGEKSGIR